MDFSITLTLSIAAAYISEYRSRKLFLKQTELTEQSDKLVTQNFFKETLLSILAHDVKSPMNRLGSVLNLINANFISSEEISMLMQKLAIDFKDVNEMTSRLLLWVKTQFDGITIRKATFNLHDIVKQNFDLVETKAIEKKISSE